MVNSDVWLLRIRDHFPVGVQKVGDEDGDIDDPDSDNDDILEHTTEGWGG